MVTALMILRKTQPSVEGAYRELRFGFVFRRPSGVLWLRGSPQATCSRQTVVRRFLSAALAPLTLSRGHSAQVSEVQRGASAEG